MQRDTGGSELYGRHRELASLDRLLDDVRAGNSRVLVLRGEAGAGKTVLLDHVSRQAPPARIMRAAGVQAESQLAYSALQQLCAPLLPYLAQLPEAQRAALSVACGLSAEPPPEPELLGESVLGLLTAAAAERPLVCLVDDVQWLDRLSALVLTSVARRLNEKPVALVLATAEQTVTGLPELQVEGLADADARALLDSVLLGPVDPRVRDRIVAEARGNPLALLELPRGLSPAELAFGVGGASSAPAQSQAEKGFQQRIAALPSASRTLLLVAAVEPAGDVPLLWRALERLGIAPDAAGPAEDAGLIDLGARVLFRHPLVRSACWRAADPSELRAVHAVLAEVTDPMSAPDRRAWHRAHAVLEPDEQVAGELERSAIRARARGGRSATAAFLDRAAALTPDPRRRAARALAAAHAHHDAGSPVLALDLLATAELGPLEPPQQAEVARLRGQLAFALNSGRQSSAPLLAAAERQLDVVAAREAYLAAMGVALHIGRLGGADQLRRAAEAASGLPPGDDVAGLFLDALVTWSLDGYRPAVPLFARALAALTEDGDLRLFWLAAMVSMEVYDDASWHRLTERAVRFGRETGALSLLPAALSYRVGALLFAGRFAEARASRDEATALSRVTGLAGYLTPAVMLAAYHGRERPALEQIEATERDARARGVGRLFSVAGYSRAVLYNGLGNYAAALEGARHGAEYPDIVMYAWNLSELVEAASRTGERGIAAEARDRLTERTSAAGTPWAMGVQALADALAGPATGTEESFLLAISQLGQGQVGLLEARARLLYGEWLRRDNRRGDAREQLRAAQVAFASMGAEAFAFRAERELLATGETVQRRGPGEPEELTPQEAQIARLAMAGRSNPEIGAELFLSPRTVEWHLRKVFIKLGIRSRRELAEALRDR